MPRRQSCSLAMAVAGVLFDGMAAGVASAMPCHSLTRLSQCLTRAAELVHEGSIDDWYCFPQGYLHTKLQTADIPSCGEPPYVVETS